MIELSGDFWQEVCNPTIIVDNAFASVDFYDAICCTTNKILKQNKALVMGGGIAKEFADKFKHLPFKFGYALDYNRTHFAYDGIIVEPINTPEIHTDYLVAFPTKNDWRDPSDINLIIRSSKQLKLIATAMQWQRILMTRPGCGLGGLRWNEVKEQIKNILDDRFVVIEKP